MMKIAVSIFSFLTATSAFAATMTWAELMKTTTEQGVVMDTEFGQYRSLSHVVPADTSVAHKADYFSTVGFLNSAGEYTSDHVEVVSENWRIDETGNWDIDQWGFVMTNDGAVTRIMHNRLIESQDGMVLAYDRVPTTVDEAEVYWNDLIAKWMNGFEAALP